MYPLQIGVGICTNHLQIGVGICGVLTADTVATGEVVCGDNQPGVL